MGKRIDEVILEKGLLSSRTLAKSFILEGKVLLNGETVLKPSTQVKATDTIEIREPREFVSRGGVKLNGALNFFNVDASNKIAVDIGASTGGFTDCLLKRHVDRVYAVDVGYGQLDYGLRNDSRVSVLEHINARNLSKAIIKENADIIVMDVSFISILKILPALRDILKDDGMIVSLVKPQFEGEKKFTKKGIVKNPDFHKEILRSLVSKISKLNFIVTDITHSTIKGGKGNIEFFFLIKKNGSLVNLSLIDKIVEKAWEESK